MAITQNMEELKALLERNDAEAPTEPAPPGEQPARPGSALARLREMAGQYKSQLDEAHRETIRKVNTLATELVKLQDDIIKELEARVEELETKNRNLLQDLKDAEGAIEVLELDQSITAEFAPSPET